jgi:hypothetical protein
MPNKSRICSDKKPDRFTAMHQRGDNFPFPSDPVEEEQPPEYRADIRSIQQRYNDYRKSVGDQQYKFEEEEDD